MVIVFLAYFASAQAVQRDMVILEIGTGTGCVYCPGAAMGAHDLVANGKHVAVIEYHNYNPGSDPFYNAAAATRCNYYGIPGYPTAYFDGTVSHVGGDPSVSLYTTYLPLYNQQYAVPSPLTVNITGTNVGNNYTITLTIIKVAPITATTLKAFLVLTESGIPYTWFTQNEINDTERLMVPGATGTDISFGPGNSVSLTLTFTKDPGWIANNCELIAFVQDYNTKTVFNGTKTALNAIPPPIPVNFSAAPTTGCSPMTVNYTNMTTGATSWSWNFPGGTPETSTLQNPTVVYSAAGSYDVTLNAFNIPGNQAGTLSKPAYISVNSLPAAPVIPTGVSAFCVNPPNQSYSTTAVPYATAYSWDLSPASAGVVTNNGSGCVIDWNDAFTGSVQLKVMAMNDCGNSSWSQGLNITLSAVPGQPAEPTGPVSFCMNSGYTDYSTAGATNANTYVWELNPSSAGTLYPGGTYASVVWSTTFSGTATLKVKGINYGCEGIWSTALTINVLANPTPYSVTGGGAYCAVGGSGIPIGLSSSQVGSNYTLYLDNTATTNTVAGTGNPVTFGNQMTAGSYSVVAVTTTGNCSNNMSGEAIVTVDPSLPAVPDAPVGPSNVYSGTTPTSDYTTSASAYAATYSWEVTPADAGAMNGVTTTGTAIWNPQYTGSASVQVKSVNTCGESSFSTTFNVAVAAGSVGLNESARSALISIYPNPASGFVTIIPARAMLADLRICNALGSEVITKSGVNLTKNYLMDISTLKTGVYFIRVSSEDVHQTIKLVVQ